MANIQWKVGDFFACSNLMRPHSEKKVYGIITSEGNPPGGIIVRDTGMRKVPHYFANVFIPTDAVPSNLAGADFAVKLALSAIKFSMGLG